MKTFKYIFAECDCGDHGNCQFDELGIKRCTCDEGYAVRIIGCRTACVATCDESSDCENAGICVWEGEDKFCDCKNGTRGDKCEHIDDCDEGIFKDCQGDKGTCYYDTERQKAKCVCSRGKSLDQNVNFCKDCDCGDNGVCVFLKGGYQSCLCYDGSAMRIIGEKKTCNETCVEDSDCNNGGVCKGAGEIRFCECPPGLSGDTCEVLDDCVTGRLRNCSGNSGVCKYDMAKKAAFCSCSKGKSLYPFENKCKECNCGEGSTSCRFEGYQKRCSCADGYAVEDGKCKKLHPCEPSPCVHGHCVVKGEDFECICVNPFTGRYCEINIYLGTCIQTKCFGGRCKIYGNREECICPAGHQLNNGTCEKIFCVEKKCYDGKCVIQNGVEMCICPDDYVLDGNECRKVKCSQRRCIGGDCRVLRGNVEDCVCPVGHVLIDDTCTVGHCTPRTCYGGRCETRDGRLECICPDGFHLEGVGCIETTCKEQNCFGGYCKVVNGHEICSCMDGHVLKNDQCQKARCMEKNCFGGKCDVVDGEEVCSCPVGFHLQGDVCREI
ncbi:hypothetical protein CDAR_186362 [Caerostris darwini]|uniref:EGF-like domain-containing protein n=1 Tax=Caerostris darwini TaxID=1538125 RepID=A0AAV4W6N2_9ARAC|nr:hypothetical protein CDAR_186362 [Caerostris darwini]